MMITITGMKLQSQVWSEAKQLREARPSANFRRNTSEKVHQGLSNTLPLLLATTYLELTTIYLQFTSCFGHFKCGTF